MTQELKNALITIAEYDGWAIENDVIRKGDGWGISVFAWLEHFCDYHTSADALLPVWRSLKVEIDRKSFSHYLAGCLITSDIIEGDYPSACIKLAEIIKQLK